MDNKNIRINITIITKIIVSITFIFFFEYLSIYAQELSIEDCQKKAEQHYPNIARFSIIEATKEYDLKNANIARLPQISLGLQASWQSDVTKIDLALPQGVPPINIPTPDKNQYNIALGINQLIWDGGKISAQKKIIKAKAIMDKEELHTEIYLLRERVNNLFFGILLLNEQLAIHKMKEDELQRNYNNIQNYMANGLANEADLSAVKVEQLKAKQERIEKESTREAYVKMLSVLIGENISLTTVFKKPLVNISFVSPNIDRPELKVFDAQQTLLDSKKQQLKSEVMPMIGAFAQSGYGKPGLNIFQKKIAPFFVGGIKISWNFSEFYTYGNKKKKIDLQQRAINLQRETFLFNLNTQIPQQQTAIEKYKKTMIDDDEIIRLRKLIREAAQMKMENGTMSVSDMLKEIIAEQAAKQAKVLHEIQYLLSLYNLKYITN